MTVNIYLTTDTIPIHGTFHGIKIEGSITHKYLSNVHVYIHQHVLNKIAQKNTFQLQSFLQLVTWP